LCLLGLVGKSGVNVVELTQKGHLALQAEVPTTTDMV